MKDEVPDLNARTVEFGLRIVRMVSSLPKGPVSDVLGRQVLRAGTSVGANYREARRSRSKAEFIAKVGDCLKEIDETAYWLELLDRSTLLPSAKLLSLRDEADQLTAIFTSIAKTAKLRKSP